MLVVGQKDLGAGWRICGSYFPYETPPACSGRKESDEETQFYFFAIAVMIK
jgi:hypothetical protein